MKHDYETTRRSWNVATRNHNVHKGDQARFFREGGDVLFPEELELLGNLKGKTLVHLQCNAGQDSLGLARRGGRVTGVDLSDEAIAFARKLSADAGIAADFVAAEVVEWLASTDMRFDIAFTSYGTTPWLPDLHAWARGVHRVLAPGGRLVYVEFHPIIWSFAADFRPTADDYFADAPFIEPVGDYVARSGESLGGGASGDATAQTTTNDVPAYSWQHSLADVLDALAHAGFVLERMREYPYSNGCKTLDGLVPLGGRRWGWPEGMARLPLMYGLSARRP
jgi:SAM-dependent methyltransferase